jgi:SAM-dependent methyltransferase
MNSTFQQSIEERKIELLEFWDSIADERQTWIERRKFYYDDIRKIIKVTIPDGERVIYIGCGWCPDLLATVNPSRGLGVDISPKIINCCRDKYPDLEFIVNDPENISINEKFDCVILCGILGFCFDIQTLLSQVKKVCYPHARIIITHYNFLWEPIFRLAEKLKLRMSQPVQNWVPVHEIQNFLEITGFELVKKRNRMLLPIYIPLVSAFFNRILANMLLFRGLCITEMLIARLAGERMKKNDATCSIIVPCKNEKGHIEQAVVRMPHIGKHMEIIFVDDKSTDETGNEVIRCMQKYPAKAIKLVEGPGICKAEAVRIGFQNASGDVLIILDGDLAVAPEELPKYFNALISGAGDFINGVRFVYPQRGQAMRILNIIGNKVFSKILSFLLEQRIGDTLCGTKAFFREDYWKLVRSKDMWGVRDQWGDFEQLFGAAKIGLKIVDIPVHYMERTYGETKMKNRFINGLFMLRMCFGALIRLRFV